MKLSDSTISVLKNFSSINQSIIVGEGNTLRTISVMKNILAEATVEETFPRTFAIYDLNEFLNGLSLHDDYTLDFSNDTYVVIREGKRRVNYHFADPEVIVAPPEKQLVLPSSDVSFQLDHSQLLQLVKAASVYKLPDLSVVGEEGTISLVVRDKKNDSSNIFSVDVGETADDFCFNFKVENTNKILAGNYDVVISQKLLAQFTGQKNNVEYFIALEPDSSFG
jgi:hypothetical protein